MEKPTVIETIRIVSENDVTERFSKETTNRLCSYLFPGGEITIKDFKTEVYARGYVGGFLNEELGIPVSLKVYSDGAIQVIPDRPIVKIETVSNNKGNILSKLLELNLEHYIISELFNYIKFNLGAFLIKDEKERIVNVEVAPDGIAFEYVDKSRFDFSKLGENVTPVMEALSVFGGSLNFRDSISKIYKITYKQRDNGTSRLSFRSTEKCNLVDDIFEFNIQEMFRIFDRDQVLKDIVEDRSSITRQEVIVYLIIMEVLSNLNFYNFQNFSEIDLVFYEGVPFPIPVPKGYEYE